MQFILDNLLAVVIACVVVLMLSAAQMRSSQAGVEQVAAHAAKAKAISFGEWLEDDLLSLGANFGTNRYRFEQPQSDDSTGNTNEFTFYSDSIAAGGDTIRVMTRYRLLPTETVTLRDTTHQLYEIRREHREVPIIDGVPDIPPFGGWTQDGSSVATLSMFEIDLLNRFGESTSVVQADYIQVSFAMVPEIWLEQGYLRELFWTTTLKVRPFWDPTPSEGGGGT